MLNSSIRTLTVISEYQYNLVGKRKKNHDTSRMYMDEGANGLQLLQVSGTLAS